MQTLMQTLMELTQRRGHPGLKMSFAQVLSLMGPDGGRIQEMAAINEVSKQAISAVAGELEGLGYLQRAADPNDGRQVILGFTTEGVRLMQDSIASTATLDRRFRDVLGETSLLTFKQTAATLYEELGLESEVFGRGIPDIEILALDLLKTLGKKNARLLGKQLMDSTEN